jgi:hypothetical protein
VGARGCGGAEVSGGGRGGPRRVLSQDARVLASSHGRLAREADEHIDCIGRKKIPFFFFIRLTYGSVTPQVFN